MVMEIPLTKGKTALVDDNDYPYLITYCWFSSKGGDTYYARCHYSSDSRKQKLVYMHRMIMNAEKHQLIDHIDHNTLNNQRSNLRICTNRDNLRNTIKRKGTTSDYKGVYLQLPGCKWISRITINNNPSALYLGSHNLEIDAAQAYDRAAIIHFGDFARLNFPHLKDQYLQNISHGYIAKVPNIEYNS